MGGRSSDAEEEVFVVLSPLEIGIINMVRSRKLGEEPLDWKEMARDIKVSETYLETICTLKIPKNSEGIPMREIERAMRGVSLGLVCWD
jgi:hypothetical protein